MRLGAVSLGLGRSVWSTAFKGADPERRYDFTGIVVLNDSRSANLSAQARKAGCVSRHAKSGST
jgi:hypothetical protein